MRHSSKYREEKGRVRREKKPLIVTKLNGLIKNNIAAILTVVYVFSSLRCRPSFLKLYPPPPPTSLITLIPHPDESRIIPEKKKGEGGGLAMNDETNRFIRGIKVSRIIRFRN